MEIHLPFSTRQKAFRSGDGEADSVWFIQAVIKHHQDSLRPLNVAFVDVKKAFDSVSHQLMLVAAARLRVPPPFLRYIRDLYSNAVTTFRISLGRGVRQALASELESQLAMCGLSISSDPRGKSASMRLDIDGKAKKWVINPLPYLLHVAGETVSAISVSQVYRYLGVDVSPCRTRANVATMLRDGLASILSAPLKPQQRLYIATYHLLPKCHHQLALSPSSAKYLRWLDWTVRSAFRSWLKLLKDTPVPFFHALWSRVDSVSLSTSTLCRS